MPDLGQNATNRPAVLAGRRSFPLVILLTKEESRNLMYGMQYISIPIHRTDNAVQNSTLRTRVAGKTICLRSDCQLRKKIGTGLDMTYLAAAPVIGLPGGRE